MTTYFALGRFSFLVLPLVGVFAAGCGDDSSTLPLGPSINDAEPSIIAGGGVGSGAINGKINVYAFDTYTKEAISNADVRIGEAEDEAPLVGKTDTTGLFTIKDAKLKGATSVTVTANGHIAASWVGVNGANVTIPMDPITEPAIPTANAEGTIEGWDALPPPAMDHILIGFVGYSWTGGLGDKSNDIQQPKNPMGIDPNACVKVAGQAPPCAWKLITRTGKQAHYAIILDVDTKGTMDQMDDSFAINGFAFQTGLDIAAGTTSKGETLKMFPTASIVDVQLTVPMPPAGIDQTVAIPLLDLGADGKLPFFLGPLGVALRMPLPTDILAGGTYEFIARATPSAMGVETPSSVSITKNVDISKAITLPNFQSPPADLVASGGTYSFKPVDGATVHSIAFAGATGERAWTVAILDGRKSFALPSLSPDPLPAGMDTMVVNALTIPSADLLDFSLDDLKDQATGLSDNAIAFTH